MSIFVIRNEHEHRRNIPPAFAEPGKVGVLLVALDHYNNSAINLTGCINDSMLIEDVLKFQFHIPSQNFTILRDKQASKANVLNACRVISTKYKWVIVHWSGHMAQTQDIDDKKHKEEIFITYYHNWSDQCLFDYEVKDALEPAGKVWLIIDACHAGGVSTRASGVYVRSIVAPPLKLKRKTTQKAAYNEFLACQSNEYAIEKPINGVPHGVFTYWLGQIWKENPGISNAELLKKLREKISEQTPIIIGPDGQFLQVA